MSGGLYRSANAEQGGAPGGRPGDGATFISAEPLNQPAVESVAPPQEQVAESSAAANSAVMAIGSLVSRGTGFLRNLMIGAALGNADRQRLHHCHVPAATGVRVPARRRPDERADPGAGPPSQADSDRGQAYAQRLLTLAVVALAVAVLIAVIAAPVLTSLYASGKDANYTGLVTKLSYLMLPMLFFTGISALIAAVLNTRGHFAAPMWAPILNNLVVIATFGALHRVFGAQARQPAEQMGLDRILLIGGGTLLGVAVQAAGLLPALRKVGFPVEASGSTSGRSGCASWASSAAGCSATWRSTSSASSWWSTC